MASVFLSHSHDDKADTAVFVDELRRAGLDVWYSLDRRLGEGFISAIDKALLDADCVVLFETESARESPWVQKEILFVDKIGKRLLVAKGSKTFTSDEFDHILSAAPSIERGKMPIKEYAQRFAALIRSTVRPRGYVTAIWGTKGGTGKSTLAAYLGHAFASMRRKTLVVDLDPQAAATSLLSQSVGDVVKSDALFRQGVNDRLNSYQVVADRLALIPASHDLVPVNMQSGVETSPHFAAAIEGLRTKFDCIIMDCGPSAGNLPRAAIRSADLLLIPIPPDRMLVDAAKIAVDLVRRDFQPNYPLPISIVTTMADGADRDIKRFAQKIAEDFPDFRPLKNFIRASGEYQKSSPARAFQRRGLFARPLRSRGAREFTLLAGEVERRLAQGARFRAIELMKESMD